jgi:hypothetical protein
LNPSVNAYAEQPARELREGKIGNEGDGGHVFRILDPKRGDEAKKEESDERK